MKCVACELKLKVRQKNNKKKLSNSHFLCQSKSNGQILNFPKKNGQLFNTMALSATVIENDSIPKARALYETAKRTRILHLGSIALREIPVDIWSLGNCLLRLDLSSNLISSLTPKIGLMTALEQLWLNDNPFLKSIPPEIENCKRLKVVDLRSTGISTLPREMGRLKHLLEVDLRETPMASDLGLEDGISSKELVLNTSSLMEMLALGDKRETLRLEMLDRVEAGVYREVASSAHGREVIPKFVQAVCAEFSDCNELQNVVRNADRLFPPFSSISSRSLSGCAKKVIHLYLKSHHSKTHTCSYLFSFSHRPFFLHFIILFSLNS
jgi:hypothetical protein